MVSDGKIYFAKTGENGDSLNEKIYLDPRMANRHGFICGATGTGKTVTLKVLPNPSRRWACRCFWRT